LSGTAACSVFSECFALQIMFCCPTPDNDHVLLRRQCLGRQGVQQLLKLLPLLLSCANGWIPLVTRIACCCMRKWRRLRAGEAGLWWHAAMMGWYVIYD